jgi:chromosome partitioning protein
MPRTISVVLPKGGVGKTTTAVNLAASFAVEGKSTLLIDLDPIGSSGASLGLTSQAVSCGLYDVFTFSSSFATAIRKTDLPKLDIVPCNAGTIQREERISRISDNRTLLRNLLRPVIDRYEYIILDCPPVLRGLTTVALSASDSVLIPLRAGHFGLDALDKLFGYLDWLRQVSSRAIAIEGILLTMHEPRTKVSDITVKELSSKYNNHLLSTIIPRNSTLSEASFYGKPAILYNPTSRGSECYRELARELMTRSGATTMTPVKLKPTIFQRFGTGG